LSSMFRRTVRGMRDLLPDEAEKLRFIERTAREVAKLHGYREVITPLVENYELLAAKVGEENRKRMYVFEDLGGRKVALRPEFTASIARLVAVKMATAPKPIRLFSTGTLYRYDEPQSGRYREFWQANYELFGSSKPEADAEIVSLTNNLMEKIGLHDYHFKIGHVGILRGVLNQEGVAEEQQNSVMQLLDSRDWDEALRVVRDAGGGSEKCLDTLNTLFEIKGKDPNTVTQEIRETVQDYPEALEAVRNLCEITGLLEAGGVETDFVIEAGFARGLEYYTGIIFEVYVPEMNAALAGGGRYDKLIELFGGAKTPATGVAPGPDRMSLALEKQGTIPSISGDERIMVIPVDGKLVGEAFRISLILRKEGLCTEIETMGRSVSNALSDASRRGITYVVIVGPSELKEGKVVLRNMKREEQKIVTIDQAIAELAEAR